MRTGLGRKNWRGGFKECYFRENKYFGITRENAIPGEK